MNDVRVHWLHKRNYLASVLLHFFLVTIKVYVLFRFVCVVHLQERTQRIEIYFNFKWWFVQWLSIELTLGTVKIAIKYVPNKNKIITGISFFFAFVHIFLFSFCLCLDIPMTIKMVNAMHQRLLFRLLCYVRCPFISFR